MNSYQVLQFISESLNDYLKDKFINDHRVVELNNVKDFFGSIPLNNLNKVVISLVNIEEEVSISSTFQSNNPNNAIQQKHYFSIIIMASAIFEGYDEALKHIDAVINFFSSTPVFTDSSPNFPTELSKINLEFVSTSKLEFLKIRPDFGVSYQPSVFYKIRYF